MLAWNETKIADMKQLKRVTIWPRHLVPDLKTSPREINSTLVPRACVILNKIYASYYKPF